MDRIDLFINVPAVKYEKLAKSEFDQEKSSAKIKDKVLRCRAVQQLRFDSNTVNAQMNILQIKQYCQLDKNSENLLQSAVNSSKISARGYHRVLRVSRTIADLDGSENIKINHVSEALAYRPAELI